MIPADLEHDDLEPAGFLGATRHDFDDHRLCDPDACPNTEQPASSPADDA